MKRSQFHTLFLVVVAACFVPSPGFGQTADSGPALGVARVSLTNGELTVRRGENGDWVAAGVNTALVEGDTVETGPGSRAEIQLDDSNLIRLDASTRVELAALGNRNFRIRLLEGRLTYSELKDGEADVDIETPLVAVRPRKNGRYEIETGPVETVIQVRRGEAEIASADGIETLKKGRMMVVRGDPDGAPEFRFASAEPRDDWDRWNESRDDRLARSESYRYVDRSIAGARDLDDYGDWRYVSGYGYSWFPQVSYGWSPYSQGRWSWVDYYGWSWVGYEPWGWAPYHYGRWFHRAGYGWGWYPGRRNYRHQWSPGLVAFVGYSGRSGFGVGVGLGYGSVGWIPLGPGERYYPWYGRGGYGNYSGGRNTNITSSTVIVDNSVNIYNNYRNARAPNGVTVVDAQGFAEGRLDNRRSLRGTELQRASLMRGQIPVVPQRQSQGRVVRAGTSATARTASARTFSRAGTASTRTVARTSFNTQQQQVAQSVRDFRTTRSGASSTARSRTATAAGGVRSGSAARGSTASAARPATRAGTRAGTRSSTPARAGTVRSRGGSVATRGSAASSTSARGRTATAGRSSTGVRSAAPSRAGDSTRWRTFGGASPSRARTSPSAGATRSTRSSSSRVTRTAPRTTSRVPTASRSRSGATANRSSATRSTSRSRFPRRSTSRVSPSRSSSRTTSRSRATAPSRSSSRSRVSSQRRTTSRVPSRSSRSTVRSAPRRSNSPSRTRSISPPRSSSRTPSRSSRPAVRSFPQRGTSRSTSRSPSRSSRPAVRSAPSRSRGSSSGGVRSTRSAPSRSAPSRSSGGTRSAPSRARRR